MHVAVNGTRLWFDVDGPKVVPDGSTMRGRPTVVLLHGGPGSFDHSYFKPEFAELAKVAQVVYLDLRDHGRSAWGDPSHWTMELCADDVRAFCDALGIEKPIVLGHSLGGFVALFYGIRHPGHASALVLQSTLGHFDVARIVESFRQFGGDVMAEVVSSVYRGTRPVTAEEWAPCWKLFGPSLPDRARAIVNLELNARALPLMQRFDVLDQLGRVDCPTLVCVGALDPITNVAAARELYEALPRGSSRLEVVEGAGHFTWLDAPDRYWPLLTEFVTSLHPSDGSTVGAVS